MTTQVLSQEIIKRKTIDSEFGCYILPGNPINCNSKLFIIPSGLCNTDTKTDTKTDVLFLVWFQIRFAKGISN